MALAETATLLLKLTLQDDVSATAANAKKGLDGVEQSATGMSDSFKTKVAAAATVAGAAIGAFGVSSVQDFAGFQTKMNEVFTLLPGISKESMGKMTDDVLAFSNETGKLPDEVIPALYQALSAGVPQDNVFDFLRTANDAAVGGATDTATAVNGLSSAVNAYGPEVLSAQQASDIFFTTIRLGKTTFPELSAAMSVVAPAAAALKIPLGDVNAAIATMTSQGEPTQSAATKMRTAILELGKAGSVADQNFQRITGETFPQFIAGGGTVQQAFQLMKDDADKSNTGVQNFFGAVEGGMAVVMTTSDQGQKTFSNNLEQMQHSADATKDAVTTMSGGIEHQADIIVANVKTMMLRVGGFLSESGLGPILTAFGPTFGRVIGAGIGGAAGLITAKLTDVFGDAVRELLPIATKQGAEIAAAQAAGASGTEALGKWGNAGKIAGNAFKLAFIAGVGLILVDVMVQQVNSAKEEIKNDPNKVTPEDLFDMRAPMWARLKVAAAQQMQGLGQASLDAFNKTWDAGIANGMSASDPALLAAAKAAGEAIGGQAGTSAVSAFSTQMPAFQHAAQQTMESTLPAWVSGGSAAGQSFAISAADDLRESKVLSGAATVMAQDAARALAAKDIWDSSARAITSSLADALRGSKDNVKSAVDDLMYVINHPLKLEKETARIEGALTSKNLADALASKNPAIKSAAEQTQQRLIELWQSLTGKAYNAGSNASANLRDGLNNDYGDAKSDASDFVSRMNAIFGNLKTNYHISTQIVKNVGGNRNDPTNQRAEGGPVKKGVAYWIGERGPELMVPDQNGTVISHEASLRMTGRSSNAAVTSDGQNILVNVVNKVVVSVREIADNSRHYSVLQGKPSGAF